MRYHFYNRLSIHFTYDMMVILINFSTYCNTVEDSGSILTIDGTIALNVCYSRWLIKTYSPPLGIKGCIRALNNVIIAIFIIHRFK